VKLSLNGKLVDADEARIDPTDRGFTLGDGVFETIAVRKGSVRHMAAHLNRLKLGCSVLRIKLAYDDPTLKKLIQETAAANNLEDAAVRLTLTRGPGDRGLVPPMRQRPTLLITAAPLPPPPTPARVIVATGTRRNELSPLARIKSLNTLDNVLARAEATNAGADDAILLNTHGNIAESSVANIFLLVDGGLLTPPVSDGALPGIARGEVIRLTHAEERNLTPDMLNRASEVFLTNALGIRPVVAVGDVSVGDGEPGLITQLLATRV
jgi:branched-chain amino acid aminotransferase